ncbi:S8 family serine peptidase [Persicitalea jodogahamensis]|uniref:Peptidase S8/S53 domain-containing protein n=1 Tax=Persicitalea jodogahamensis TaxID=402147 RepID=A0A8J3G6X6_9BACT|nr:S8 family serine peptidase [Persicitalea jodogahamensis]GHB51988.1 hypothetical protein GCM10007390_00730 [Persicitalea jodogahamensis]
MPQDPDYSDSDSKKRAADNDILTPPLRRIGDPKAPHRAVPNQKIVVVSPELPGLQEYIERQKRMDQSVTGNPDSSGQVIPRPPALENSANNFFRSLANLIEGWLRWLLGGKEPETKQPVVREDGSFAWFFDHDQGKNKKVQFRIVRASECFNDKREHQQGASVDVLLEWDGRDGQGELADFAQLYAQAENHFIANPHPPSHETAPPINANAVITKVYDSDFRVFENSDGAHYSNSIERAKDPIVAVMDTGLKYKWESAEPLIDTEGNPFKFKIARAPADSCLSGADFGYCSIVHYLQKPVFFQQLAVLTPLTAAQIKSSPYDDHKVDEEVEDEQAKGGIRQRRNVGRHGTLITGILNRNGCQVLPVKSFNCAAQGTLADVLSGLNYLIAKKTAGMPIKVLNASFGGRLDSNALDLLYRKIKTLTDLGVWVVASSGNENISLDGTSIYPAQFGVSEGTYSLEKVITVNSFYDGSVQGNTGAAVSLTAKSGRLGGFPSALPLTDSPNHTLQGTSFAAPYVACALATIETAGLSRQQVLDEITAKTIGEVTFSRNT